MINTLMLTEAAALQVQTLIADEENAIGLRVFIQGGGCAGFQYGFSFAEQIEEDDLVIETNDVKLLVDPMSLMYLQGATVDYKSDLRGSRFTIDNPNSTSQCGCNQSFSV